MSKADNDPVRHHPWLLVGGSLVVGYAVARRAASHATATRTEDDFAIVKAEIFGFLLGALWAIGKQVVSPTAAQRSGEGKRTWTGFGIHQRERPDED